MSNILNQTLIIGYPASGKSTYLNSLNSNPFIWRNYKKETLEATLSVITEKLKQYHSENNILYMDEPFFLNSPLLQPELFFSIKQKSFNIATHRISYFCLLNPTDITLMDRHVHKKISSEELCNLVEKPTEEFYRSDVTYFANFLNGFLDVQISPEICTKIQNHPILKKIRTTPFVRDAMILFSRGFNLDQYVMILEDFFKKNIDNVNEVYGRIIKKQLFPLIF